MGLVVRLMQVQVVLVIPGREVRNILVLAVPHIQGREGLDTVVRAGRALMAQEALLTLVLAALVTRDRVDPVTLARAVAILVLRCVNKFCLTIGNLGDTSSLGTRSAVRQPFDIWLVLMGNNQ